MAFFVKETIETQGMPKHDKQSLAKSIDGRLTFCVEGNISVGKSTFLRGISNVALLRNCVEVVSEPIAKWRDVGPTHHNLLDAFYVEPQRHAYIFQNYVFLTRALQEKESAVGAKPLRLMERSVFSDRMVFVPEFNEAKWMNEIEMIIYNSWFDLVVSSLPGLVPDGFIYLRASPATCYERMLLRGREEEFNVTLSYLQSLHEKHENWLFPFHTANYDVQEVEHCIPVHKDNLLDSEIKEHVFYIEGRRLHSTIKKIPVLVVDCEPNVDFDKDVEASKRYACLVLEFSNFVKKQKEDHH